MINILQIYYSCINLIITYIPKPLILFNTNYIFTIGLIAAFMYPCKFKSTSYIEITNNELPKYSDINELPPSYDSN